MTLRTIRTAVVLSLVAGVAGPAAAQSSPSLFDTVFNIGDVPPGSVFDVPGAVTGTQVGDGDVRTSEAFITPTSLDGDTLGSNSQLNLFDGGEVLLGFSAGPSNRSGSNIEFNILGGNVVGFFAANAGSTVNISGGVVEVLFSANADSTVNISGGVVGDSINANNGSTFNISGGSVGDNFGVSFDSTINISGGSIGDDFDAFPNSEVNLFGTSFFLDGVELTDLVIGEAFTVTNRDVTLTGLLADGSAFDFDLNSTNSIGNDFFSTGATLTITLVPTPGAAGVLALAGVLSVRRRR